MELKVNEYQLPEQILFNYEELKAELTEKVTRTVKLDTAPPVIKSATITPNPVDCGKTFVISVEVTD